jgi:fatty acid synthase subunit beta, fungi type
MDTPSSEMCPSDLEGELSLVLDAVQSKIFVNQEDLEQLKDQRELFLVEQASSTREPVNSEVELALIFLRHLINNSGASCSIRSFLQGFDNKFLVQSELHLLMNSSKIPPQARNSLLSTYYHAVSLVGSEPISSTPSALLTAAQSGHIHLYAIFGGQGTANATCVKELIDLYNTYAPQLKDLIDTIAPLLSQLSRLSETREHYCGRYLDLQAWLRDPSTIPNTEFISAVTVSCPIIGLLGLAHYCLTCKIVGKTPGQLQDLLQGATGHSQGIVVATAIAMADSWEGFYSAAVMAVETLFWIGFECHKASPRSSISPLMVDECASNSQGQPSCMLSVIGLESDHLQKILSTFNKTLPSTSQVDVALTNTRDNFVIGGPARSLVLLARYLQTIKADPGKDQNRTPSSKRRPTIQHQFLPISVPFHTNYLSTAAANIKDRLASLKITSEMLKIPVHDNRNSHDLRYLSPRNNLVDELIDAICSQACNWPAALESSTASHIITFGSGGIVDLVMKLVDGKGVRVISGSEFDTRDPEIGTKMDLFSPLLLSTSTKIESWAERYQPQLTQSASGEVRLETKLSKLLGAPPVFVAGMTPTTVPWDFVSAIMNAGYHTELASGGYYNAEEMSAAIEKVKNSVPVGRGITCNLIYSSPQAMTWQIAMLRRLAQQGVAVDGLTIGAGVPSQEIMTDYITSLGLKHISLKPGSVSAIREVIEIAKAQPHFPIVLQWTGGRGGGHHSYEDFHAPILRTYATIRRCSNIILVAGSGFGTYEDMYPYISGSWSTRFGYPSMPFDGVLLGSRMMVAREAHTSPAAKRFIIEASGVTDADWEKTYEGSTGGVITVVSEMGQPIHKLATRGVLFWHELDKTIFSLPRKSRVEALLKKRQYIIKKLNADFAKPWFGQNSDGEAVDLEEMTYIEVMRRLVTLMYVSHQNRWIASSYTQLAMDFAIRTLERLPTKEEIDISVKALVTPHRFIEDFIRCCPQALTELINPEDVTYFILRCKSRGQKPVNFIPCIDDDFETFFKKDSLWQSEDMEAVVGQDAGRCCILHGPVAAQYCKADNESAKDILDKIHNGLIEKVCHDFYPAGLTPQSESASLSSEGWSVATPDSDSRGVALAPVDSLAGETGDLMLSTVLILAKMGNPWIRSLFTDEYVLRGTDRKVNPFRRLIQRGSKGTVDVDPEASIITLSVENEDSLRSKSVIKITCHNDIDISVELTLPSAHRSESVVLPLQFQYDSTMTPYGIKEVTVGHDNVMKSFYSKIWFGEDISESTTDVRSTLWGPEMTLTPRLLEDVVETIGRVYPHGKNVVGSSDVFPISVGIIGAWDAVAKPIVLSIVPGDLLRLVHQSNSFEYFTGAPTLRVGDIIKSNGKVRAVYIEDAGKYVTVEGHILCADRPVLKVTSTFLFKGVFNDFQSTFRDTDEPEMILEVTSEQDEAILRDREWFHLDDPSLPLVGRTLLFQLRSEVTWKSKSIFETLQVSGHISQKNDHGEVQQIGHVDFQHGECAGNPVVEFLQRKGRNAAFMTDLTSPGWAGVSSVEVQMPSSNEMYTRVSRDYNPIHMSSVFSHWAELPGTISQGMFTSAIAVSAVEHLSLNGERQRLRRFSATFTDMVLPGDRLLIRLKHVGAIDGRLVFKVSAFKADSEDVVLEAEAEVEQPQSVFFFTGQGSQVPGMGMDLYKTSEVAQKIWDEIDAHIFERFGTILMLEVCYCRQIY